MRRPRWRCWGKWVAAIALVLTAAVWFASGWFMANALWGRSPPRYVGVSIGLGQIRFVWSANDGRRAGLWLWVGRTRESPEGTFADPIWLWGYERSWPRKPGSAYLRLPIWPLLVLEALSTLWLWRTDRRIAGHCSYCNYDLAATPSGPCPECGRRRTVVAP